MITVIAVIAGVIAAGCLFGVPYLAFRRVFYWPQPRPHAKEIMPDTRQYRPYKKEILKLLDAALALPYEPVTIRSRDGLELFGKYYHVRDGAPLVIMLHGYKSPLAERDFEGGIQICLALQYNFLLADQRAQGKSQGRVITFGIRERYDCLDWIRYANSRFGTTERIFLYGVSMGAATVLMASDLELPDNVAGIVADCGYTSPEAIIRKVIADMKLPAWAYGFVRLAAFWYGHLKLHEASALEAVRHTKIPILFFHGEEDHYVPCRMSRELYEACAGEKEILTVPEAGHGMSFFGNRKGYTDLTEAFMRRHEGKEKAKKGGIS